MRKQAEPWVQGNQVIALPQGVLPGTPEQPKPTLAERIAEEQAMPKPSSGANCLQAAKDLLDRRAAVGLARYGQPLTTGNGRDFERDADEEIGDFLLYYVGMRIEQRARLALLPEALELIRMFSCPQCENRIGWNGDPFRERQHWKYCARCKQARAVLAKAAELEGM